MNRYVGSELILQELEEGDARLPQGNWPADSWTVSVVRLWRDRTNDGRIASSPAPEQSILALKGLRLGFTSGEEVDAYIDELRNEWDR